MFIKNQFVVDLICNNSGSICSYHGASGAGKGGESEEVG